MIIPFTQKAKIAKVIKEYERLWDMDVPKDAIGREELLELKELKLQELALAYKVLKGYSFEEFPIPGKHNLYPKSYNRIRPETGNIASKLHKLKYLKFVHTTNYDEYPEYTETLELYKCEDKWDDS